jgi:hypothetical protein
MTLTIPSGLAFLFYGNLSTDGRTFVSAEGLAFTLSMGLLMVVLPRRYALVPVIVLTCYMTMGQRIIVATLDFTMLRILLLFGWARLILRREASGLHLNPVDKMILWWTLVSIISHTLLYQNTEEFINRLGFAYNVLLTYFLFRFLVLDLEDVKRVIKLTAVMVMPLAVSMLLEYRTQRNVFAVFGAVPFITQIRDGILRCQGPFSHPILAGSFGAALLPLFVGLWWQGRGNRFWALVGMVSATAITFTSGSSGPVMSYLAAIIGLAVWPLRKQMRSVRWGLLLGIIGLHLVMKAPVWYIFARVNIFSGSTGYHRSMIIDSAIKYFWDWWLVGTKSTQNWGDHGYDITNEYIWHGVEGGILAMLLFIWIIVRCYSCLGWALKTTGKELPSVQGLFWVLGAALFTHLITFFGVQYFDQNFINWYLLLAMISSATLPYLPVRQPVGFKQAIPWKAGPRVESVPPPAYKKLGSTFR